jgi:hypothetical protein
MVDVQSRPEPPAPSPDATTRRAALWATVVAVPVAALAGVLIFNAMLTGTGKPAPTPTATPPAAVPADPVPLAAPKLAARPAAVCLAVTSQLPPTVRDLVARKVSAGPEQNAAYGAPALTVSCGVAQPTMCASLEQTGSGCVPLDTELMTMNRVCWYADAQPGATTFTTMDREVAVRVSVPEQYAQPAQWANEFSDIVVKTDRSRTEGVPSGCA